MTTKPGTAALLAAALLWSGSALAEECHRGPFNGLYIGASAGYAGIESDFHPQGQAKLSGDGDGVIVGGHVGYNFQCGRVVIGVEGDLSYLDVTSKAVAADLTAFRSSVDWLGTLRGRLGVVVHESVMLYATAGVAWTDRTHSVSDPGTVSGIVFSQSNSDTATGYVVGGGVELLRHDDRWLLRAEALYVGLGDENRTYAVTTGCGGVCTTSVKWEDDFVVARLGLSVRLGGHEPKYEPLK